MTELQAEERCRWCGRRLPDREGPGRPRRYCKAGCRQQAHLARKLAASHGLGDDDVIIDRQRLEELQGQVYTALGVATSEEIGQIHRELTKLSKKVDALVSKKGSTNSGAEA